MPLDIVTNDHLGGYAHANAEYPNGDPDCYFPALWQWMMTRLNVRSVLDVGCGEGHALKWFMKRGCRHAWGLEGCRDAIDASPVRHRILRIDFTEKSITEHAAWKWLTMHPFDAAWCCEFVEHVDEQFIGNWLPAFGLARYVAMTHADPGQEGYHHVTCRPGEFWVERLAKEGVILDPALTEESRRVENTGHWARSGMVFRRGT